MAAVDTPFYFFFGIVGLVVGCLIVWFLMIDRPFETPEVRGGPVDAVEAPLIAKALADDGMAVDEAAVARVIELHSAYFDGHVHESLAAAEDARMEAERARLEAEAEAARKEGARARRTTPKAGRTS